VEGSSPPPAWHRIAAEQRAWEVKAHMRLAHVMAIRETMAAKLRQVGGLKHRGGTERIIPATMIRQGS
jgi:hypothetical protein